MVALQSRPDGRDAWEGWPASACPGCQRGLGPFAGCPSCWSCKRHDFLLFQRGKEGTCCLPSLKGYKVAGALEWPLWPPVIYVTGGADGL